MGDKKESQCLKDLGLFEINNIKYILNSITISFKNLKIAHCIDILPDFLASRFSNGCVLCSIFCSSFSSTSFIFFKCYAEYKNVLNCFCLITFEFNWFEIWPLFNPLHLLQNVLCTRPTRLPWQHKAHFLILQQRLGLTHSQGPPTLPKKVSQSEITLTQRKPVTTRTF